MASNTLERAVSPRGEARRFSRSAVALALAFAGCSWSTAAPGGVDDVPPPPHERGDACLAVSPRSSEALWLTPGRPTDARSLGAWCSAVGPAVVAASPGTGRADPLESVAILTWNVHVGGGDLLALVEDLRSGELTGGEPVDDFVLLLQEVHRGGVQVPDLTPDLARVASIPSTIRESPPTGERIDVTEAARRLGLHLFYAPSMRNGGADPALPAEDRGNAILSTLPLTDLTAVELPYEAQRRVAVAATVSLTTADGVHRRLRVVSGHLDTRSRWSRLLDSFGAGRTRQARALARAITDEPAVLGADLNTWSVGFLEGALSVLREQFPTATIGEAEATYVAAGLIPRRLDHLLFRLPEGWRARVRRVDDRYGSDHHPLLGTVRFGGATAES